MNEPVAGLMQRDALLGPIILKITDSHSSGVTSLICYQGHISSSSAYKHNSIRLKGVHLDIN